MFPNKEGEAIARLPTYSETMLTNNQNVEQLVNPPAYGPDDRLTSDRPALYQPQPSRRARIINLARQETRIVNHQTNTLEIRGCWANPFQAERPGCESQQYRGGWYTICRLVSKLMLDLKWTSLLSDVRRNCVTGRFISEAIQSCSN